MTELIRHFDLLVALLTRDAARTSAALDAANGALSSFGTFARRNQLSGFIHALVTHGQHAGSLPGELVDELEQRHAAESRKRAVIRSEISRLIRAFRDEQVDCILLKGPQLASRFYGDDDQRVYWDLDLLVRQEDLGTSRGLLKTCGFEQQSVLLFGERITVAVAHALDFARGEVGLDLHWKLSSHPSFHVDYRRLWERREEWSAEGLTCDVLSPDYVLTLNLLSSLKDIERGAFRARSFVDLWMILGRLDEELDWDRFLGEREEENIESPCASVLALFLLVFHASERFPRLARSLASRRSVVPIATRHEAVDLIQPTFLGPARRLWVSQLYQTPPGRHLAWWALSLPVRLNVHKPGKMKRFTRSLRSWLRTPR